MRLKDLAVELRDRIVSRHRSGGGCKNITAALKVTKYTVASVVLKLKKFGTTLPLFLQLFLELAAQPNSNMMRSAIGHSDIAPEFLCRDGRTFQKDNDLCSTPLIRPLW